MKLLRLDLDQIEAEAAALYAAGRPICPSVVIGLIVEVRLMLTDASYEMPDPFEDGEPEVVNGDHEPGFWKTDGLRPVEGGFHVSY